MISLALRDRPRAAKTVIAESKHDGIAEITLKRA